MSSSLFDTSISSVESNVSADDDIPKIRSKQLRLSVCNFQSIRNKSTLLTNFLIKNNVDVMVGSESHLSSITGNSEILPPTYTATREDRDDGYGGVIIIRKKELKVEEIRMQNPNIVAIKIMTFEKPVIVCACYRSTSNEDNDNIQIINKLNELLKKYKNIPIWLAGDFNLPDIDWSTNSIVSNQNRVELNEHFLELFDKHKLSQHVDFNTRLEALLDLLLTNRPTFLVRCLPLPGFGDHDTCVLADIICHPQKHKPIQRTVYCWKRANIDQLRQDIDKNIKDLMAISNHNTPINDLWCSFKDIIINAQNAHVPKKTTSKRFHQPWFNRVCQRAVRKKKRSYRQYKETKNRTDWENYIKSEKAARKTCEQIKNSYIKNNIINSDGKKNKNLFSYIKSKRNEVIGVSPLVDSNNVTQIDDNKIAEILNNQFASVFSKDDGLSPEIRGEKGSDISNLVFTTNGIRKLLSDINTKKACGPDNISARILHECSEILPDFFVLLFTTSIKQGTIPDDWRHALITPLYKGGNKDRSKAENYRPVSLTSVTCKLMEHIIHSHIMNHFDKDKTLSNTQHGFRKFRSCETQLIQTINTLAKSLNNREQTDSILLDFSKAFDKVCHRKLLLKLEHYGIRGALLTWIQDFLSNRSQCVAVRGTLSRRIAVTSGVPQGSVLGPLLFLVYINDMPLHVDSSIALFADDAYLYKVIKCLKDTEELQQDLDKLVLWEKNWSMQFHPDKCYVLRVTNKRKIVENTYKIHNQELKVVEKAKYLGVTISRNLSWKHHVSNIVAKANSTRIFLQRNLSMTDSETRLVCYKTYVRPICEYASSVWDSPGVQSLASQLESVQRKSLRWIYNKWDTESSPTALRKSANIDTLEKRRTINRLKIFHNLHYGLKYVDKSILPTRQRCKNIKFQQMLGSIKSYTMSFFPCVVKLWNSLPNHVTSIEDCNLFTNEISVLDI